MNAEKIGHLADELEKTERIYTDLKGAVHPWNVRINDWWLPKRVSDKLFKAIWAAIDDSAIEVREEIRKAAGSVTKG